MRKIRIVAVMIVGLLLSFPASTQNKPIPGETKNVESTPAEVVSGKPVVLPDGRHDFDFEVGTWNATYEDWFIGFQGLTNGTTFMELS